MKQLVLICVVFFSFLSTHSNAFEIKVTETFKEFNLDGREKVEEFVVQTNVITSIKTDDYSNYTEFVTFKRFMNNGDVVEDLSPHIRTYKKVEFDYKISAFSICKNNNGLLETLQSVNGQVQACKLQGTDITVWYMEGVPVPIQSLYRMSSSYLEKNLISVEIIY